MVWLAAIVVVGVAVAIATSWLWGVVAAVATLALSEVVERRRRARIREAHGTSGVSVRDAITRRRRTR